MVKYIKSLFRFFFLKRKLVSKLESFTIKEKGVFIEAERENKIIKILIKSLREIRAKDLNITLEFITYFDIATKIHWKKPMIKGEFRIKCCSWAYIELTAFPGEEYTMNFAITQKNNVLMEEKDLGVGEAFSIIRKKYHIRKKRDL